MIENIFIANTALIQGQPRREQNGRGQNGTDKMVWTKWYTDKIVLGKMVRTKWYGQNGTILYFVYNLFPFNSIYIW